VVFINGFSPIDLSSRLRLSEFIPPTVLQDCKTVICLFALQSRRIQPGTLGEVTDLTRIHRSKNALQISELFVHLENYEQQFL
jgi:hypothetical protein